MKNSKNCLDAGSKLTAFALILFAIALTDAAKDFNFKSQLEAVAFIILLIGFGLIVFGRFFSRRSREVLPPNCIFRKANEDDLERIVGIGIEEIGAAHPTAADLKPFMKKNPDIMSVIANKYFDEILAYFWIFPLNADATARIKNSEILNAKDLRPEDLTTFGEETSLYLAMIAGRGRKAKGAILQEFFRKLSSIKSQNQRLLYFFARKATKDGERLMLQHGFRPIKKPSEISKVSREDLDALLEEQK